MHVRGKYLLVATNRANCRGDGIAQPMIHLLSLVGRRRGRTEACPIRYSDIALWGLGVSRSLCSEPWRIVSWPLLALGDFCSHWLPGWCVRLCGILLPGRCCRDAARLATVQVLRHVIGNPCAKFGHVIYCVRPQVHIVCCGRLFVPIGTTLFGALRSRVLAVLWGLVAWLFRLTITGRGRQCRISGGSDGQIYRPPSLLSDGQGVALPIGSRRRPCGISRVNNWAGRDGDGGGSGACTAYGRILGSMQRARAWA